MSSPYWNLHLPRSFWDKVLGRHRDLVHLEPVVLVCPLAERELRVNVRYSMHCFTIKFDAAQHSQQSKLLDAHQQPRCFDEDRYALSRQLPGMVQSLPTSKVRQSYMHGQRNFVHFVSHQIGVYQMFFSLRRANSAGHELDMFIESAYVADAPSAGRGTMRFHVLADKVRSGKPFRFPAK
jgi:hypothetical protein